MARMTVGDRVFLSQLYRVDDMNPKNRRGHIVRVANYTYRVLFDCGMEKGVSIWRLKPLYKAYAVVEPVLCGECEKPLSWEEHHHYVLHCEDCERRDHEALQL